MPYKNCLPPNLRREAVSIQYIRFELVRNWFTHESYQREDGNYSEGQNHQYGHAESCGDVAEQDGYSCYGDGVEQLGSGVVDVVTCGAHGGQDCGVRDGGAVVAEDGSGENRTDVQDYVALFGNQRVGQRDAERHKDTHGTVGCSCCEGDDGAHDKDDGRQQEGGNGIGEHVYEISGSSEFLNDTGKGPCEQQDYCGDVQGFNTLYPSGDCFVHGQDAFTYGDGKGNNTGN